MSRPSALIVSLVRSSCSSCEHAWEQGEVNLFNNPFHSWLQLIPCWLSSIPSCSRRADHVRRCKSGWVMD